MAMTVHEQNFPQNCRGSIVTVMTSATTPVGLSRIGKWSMAWRNFWSKTTAIDEAARVFFPLTYVSFIVGYFCLFIGKAEQGSLSTNIPN